MPLEALARVGDGDLARDHERPVAGLQRQQLAHRGGAGARARGHDRELGRPRREGDLGDRRPRPGRQIAASPQLLGLPRSTPRAPTAPARARSSASSSRTSCRPWRRTPRRPPRARRRPHTTSARAAPCRARRPPARRPGRPLAVLAQARARPSDEVGGVLARAARAPPRGRRRRRRCSTGCGGGSCGGGSRGRRRRRDSPVAPHQRHRRAVDRHEHDARRRRSGRRCSRAPSPKRPVSSTQRARTPASPSAGSSHGA